MTGGPTWSIGYYGKLNRVRTTIEQMPGFRIIDAWQHHDVTLEDFGFTFVSNTGHTSNVVFWENSDQMRMTKRGDIEAYVRASTHNPR